MIIYKLRNKSSVPPEVNDGLHNTTDDSGNISIDIRSESNAAQTFDAIYIRCKNVTSYIPFIDSSPHTVRTLPANVTAADGTVTSITRGGWQHDLHKFNTTQTASTIQFTITGTNFEVSDIMILKREAEITTAQRAVHGKIDRDSILEPSLSGMITRRNITGTSKMRWLSEIQMVFSPDTHLSAEQFLDFIENNSEIVFAQDPDRFPWRVYRAIFPNIQHSMPYLCDMLPAGNKVTFRIEESRPAEDIADPPATFNTDTSGVMFFESPANLGQNRELDDRNFNTGSTSPSSSVFDISNKTFDSTVTHMFLKFKNTGASFLASAKIQRRQGTSWTDVETINIPHTNSQLTPVSYNGFVNALIPLSAPFTGSEIRVVWLAMGGYEIVEVYFMRLAGRLNITGVLPHKVDTASIIHGGATGGVNRSRRLGGERAKWQVDYEITFGATDTNKFEDFLDWLDAHPNFAIAINPDDAIWRTFPCVVLDNEFQTQYLTRDTRQGVTMNIKIQET